MSRRRRGGPLDAIEAAWLGSAGVALGHRGNWRPEPIEAACPRCGRSVGMGEFSPDDGRCPGCRPEKLRWERLLRLGEFDGDLRRAVLETKYGRWRMQGAALGRLLGERLGEALAAESIDPSSAVLVPSPMPWLRRMRRGLDHALAIARGARETSGCRIEPLLARRGGPTQAQVAASARAKNIRSQISVRRRVPGDADVLVLIDDVRTTGATLDACCRALEPGLGEGVRMWAAVVSVAGEPGRRRSGGG
ncbi:MAG: ComF family protein [Planctomycetota bacterium]